MILYVLNFIKGILTISVRGAYLDRFFNICATNDIKLWNIKKHDIDTVYCNILISDYKKLSKVIKNTKCTASIVYNKGVPSIYKRFRKRYALICGAFLCFFCYYVLTNFLWHIEIHGTDKTALVYEALERSNIKIGTKISNIDARFSQNFAIKEYDEFLWFAVNISGNSAEVLVQPREPLPDIIEKDVPCDIFAEKSGIIYSIDVLAGEKAIDVGETFTAGDLLISSEVVNYPQVEEFSPRLVHSIGNIKANIWYDTTRVMPTEIYLKHYTGREKTKYSIVFFKNVVNLFKNSGNYYTNYDKIIDIKNIKLSDGLSIPICLKIESYKEYELTSAKINHDALETIILENIELTLKQSIAGDIVSKEHKTSLTDDLITVKSSIKTLEQIGYKKER